jgi:hypothetical protein
LRWDLLTCPMPELLADQVIFRIRCRGGTYRRTPIAFPNIIKCAAAERDAQPGSQMANFGSQAIK